MRVSGRIKKDNSLRIMTIAQQKLVREGRLSGKELATLGMNYARYRAPYDTGRVFNHIDIQQPSGNNIYYKIITRNPMIGAPKSYQFSPSRLANFNLIRWMHTSANAFKHIKSGSPVFMYDTKSFLERVAKTRVTGRYKNLKLR